jgi:hypothetical protein
VHTTGVPDEPDLPLDALRVLLGNLCEAGLIETHEPPSSSGTPSVELLEELLAGLRAL